MEVAEATAGSDRAGGVRDVRLFRNGSLVQAWRGEVTLRDGRATLEADVAVIAADNHFTAYAFNRDNIKSPDARVEVTGAQSLRRRGKLRVLSIGVNSYANPQYDLRYAVADAQDFATQTKISQTKLDRYDAVDVSILLDARATKHNILHALTDLAARTEPEDAVMIYFAGHGTAQGDRFYLLPHDLGYTGSRRRLTEAGFRTILEHSISDRELEQSFERVGAGQILFVIDACNSGQALEAEEKRRGPMNSRGLAQLAYEKGMHILTAAQGFQAAKESQQLGHGYLTYALVEEGLKTSAADRDEDGSITLREWLDHAAVRVPELQRERLSNLGAQPRPSAQEGRASMMQSPSSSSAGTRLLLLQEAADPTVGGVQRPRVFYRREREAQPLVVVRLRR